MASGTRGYSSYRGRGRKGKIFLAILLILIILGSVGFIMNLHTAVLKKMAHLRHL